MYCDFYFSTKLRSKSDFVQALLQEIQLRNNFFQTNESIESIYFGGGTPSLLSESELSQILESIHHNFSIANSPEITLETNPDDINPENLKFWKKIGINRLSIGVQSFFDEDLRWMKRIHSAEESENTVKLAQNFGFDNLNIDLIYALPKMTLEKWQANLKKFIALKIPHLSAYSLTVETKTALNYLVKTQKITQTPDGLANEQFLFTHDLLENHNYSHYEISNYAIAGMESRHNSAYWHEKKYLGLGPSAHSYNQKTRFWNLSNVHQYIRSLNLNEKPIAGSEKLSDSDKMNERIMTSLRLKSGLDLRSFQSDFGQDFLEQNTIEIQKLQSKNLVKIENNHFKLTRNGMLIADQITAAFFSE